MKVPRPHLKRFRPDRRTPIMSSSWVWGVKLWWMKAASITSIPPKWGSKRNRAASFGEARAGPTT